jgi:hypothetical protein
MNPCNLLILLLQGALMRSMDLACNARWRITHVALTAEQVFEKLK